MFIPVDLAILLFEIYPRQLFRNVDKDLDMNSTY